MTSRSLTLGAIAVAAGSILVLSLGWGLQHAAMSNPTVLGRVAPHLAIQTPNGQQVRIWQLQGRPVVLNFWASWCGPCVEEGSVLATAAQSTPGVAFVGADNRDTTSGFEAFEQQHPHPYPAGPIVTGSYQSYGVAPLPETFFIDSQGIVTASFTGPLDGPTLARYLKLISS